MDTTIQVLISEFTKKEHDVRNFDDFVKDIKKILEESNRNLKRLDENIAKIDNKVENHVFNTNSLRQELLDSINSKDQARSVVVASTKERQPVSSDAMAASTIMKHVKAMMADVFENSPNLVGDQKEFFDIFNDSYKKVFKDEFNTLLNNKSKSKAEKANCLFKVKIDGKKTFYSSLDESKKARIKVLISDKGVSESTSSQKMKPEDDKNFSNKLNDLDDSD